MIFDLNCIVFIYYFYPYNFIELLIIFTLIKLVQIWRSKEKLSCFLIFCLKTPTWSDIFGTYNKSSLLLKQGKILIHIAIFIKIFFWKTFLFSFQSILKPLKGVVNSLSKKVFDEKGSFLFSWLIWSIWKAKGRNHYIYIRNVEISFSPLISALFWFFFALMWYFFFLVLMLCY